MSTPHNKTQMSNYDFMCMLLYIIENSCNLRVSPNQYINGILFALNPTVVVKNETIDRFFKAMQAENIIEMTY